MHHEADRVGDRRFDDPFVIIGLMTPGDGHPTAYFNRLISEELLRLVLDRRTHGP